MKKLLAVVFLFMAGIVSAAVYFSPLCALGAPVFYANNSPQYAEKGVCYGEGSYRIDARGGMNELYAALDKISAHTVSVRECDTVTVVYAYSPRVSDEAYTFDGKRYNVMAAYDRADEKFAVGAPVLEGCY